MSAIPSFLATVCNVKKGSIIIWYKNLGSGGCKLWGLNQVVLIGVPPTQMVEDYPVIGWKWNKVWVNDVLRLLFKAEPINLFISSQTIDIPRKEGLMGWDIGIKEKMLTLMELDCEHLNMDFKSNDRF